MSEQVTYVNRSNLATFLKKIKELIPSVSSFLTRSQADELYEGKLKYYTEDEESQSATMQVTSDDGKVAALAVADTGVAVGGSVPVQVATVGSNINIMTIGGDIRLATSLSDGKAYYNDSEILSEASVVDSLESDSATAPLSANQGKVLNEKFDDILLKSDVSADNDVAMLSRLFAFPLASYAGGGAYLPSSETITKYEGFLQSLAYNELVMCTYGGVKGLYRFVGDTSARSYTFVASVADLNDLPTGVADDLNTNSATYALSARQGQVLDERISEIEDQIYNRIWVMKLTTTNPISRSLLYPQVGTPRINDIILGLDYSGDYPVTPFRVTSVDDDSIKYTVLTALT